MKRPQPSLADPLTDSEKRFFVKHGYLHVASAVPTSHVCRARRAINHSLGAGIDRRDVARMNAQSFCEELVEDARLLRLATNPGAWSCARSLLGDRRVERPRECQIALRFPLPEGSSRKLDAPHLDGYHTPYNGLPDDGVVYGFSLLLGVMLSDVEAPLSGNFTVWPGTHRKLERYFREQGVNYLDQGDVTTSGIRLPRPVSITGKSGDIVLAHYQIAHAASPNLSSDIRYMCFFRLSVRGLANHRVESMLDIWRDWPALRQYIGRHSDRASTRSARHDDGKSPGRGQRIPRKSDFPNGRSRAGCYRLPFAA